MLYSEGMVDLHWDEPNTAEVELSEEELAELDRRIEAAKQGPWYSMEEVRAMMQQWATKYGSSKAR
jgi:hypothetical protein